MGPVWIARCPPSWSPADAQADMDCLHKVPAQVRPAAAPLHIRQAIAALAAVRLQISLEAFEEVRRMEPCGGCLLLGLIEKAELSFHVFRLFTGCAEEFFRKIIDLFIQDRHCFIIRSNGLAQGIDKLILASDCHIQLADRVLILHDSGVLRVFCHLSLPPLLMLLLYHRKHLE